jgi:predicted tellurium resistance membrane protein TerC
MTAYIAVAIAALIGAGLRLRTSLQRYPVVRGLLILVLVIVASTLVAFMRLPVLQPFVELSTPPWWLWLLALVWMVLGAALEWGRQQIDKLPK